MIRLINTKTTALLAATLWIAPVLAETSYLDRICRTVKTWWDKACGKRSLEEWGQDFEYGIEWTFDQVAGLDHIKAQFEPALAYAEDPVKYANIGAHIITNYVFYGPPTTSKSFFAVALAGEMKKRNPHIRILRISTQIFSDFGLEATIALIRRHAPCVVCIEESRKAYTMPWLELLRELGNGNISPSPDRPVFLLLCTTNKLEPIDTSLASMGNFGKAILFTRPSFTERIHIINKILLDNRQDMNDSSIKQLAEKTEGCPFIDIQLYIHEAILQAATYNVQLTTDLIVDVINKYTTGC